MPVHLFEWDGTQKWLSTTGQFDYTDLAHPPLDFYLGNTHHPIQMFTAIGSINLDFSQFFQLEFLDQIRR